MLTFSIGMVIPLKHLNFLFVSIFVVGGGCGDAVVAAIVVVDKVDVVVVVVILVVVVGVVSVTVRVVVSISIG